MTRDTNEERNGAGEGSPEQPRPKISDSLKKPLAKRFYESVAVKSGPTHQLLLDGRTVKTPKKRLLEVSNQGLANAIADEWRAQTALIDPATMPLTRFANTAIDAVADAREAVVNDIVAYAASDLVCYRAEGPQELVVLQARHWNPILKWAADSLGARFNIIEGVMPRTQPEATLAAVRAAIEPYDAFRLAGLHVVTTLTGSALIALALNNGAVSADEGWNAAHVDEDYQISLWGEDAEAAARRRARRAEFDAAYRWLKLLA